MLKKLSTFLPIIGLLVFSSCRDGEKGEPGPSGSGALRTDNGNISGTIYYKYPNGDDAAVKYSNSATRRQWKVVYTLIVACTMNTILIVLTS